MRCDRRLKICPFFPRCEELFTPQPEEFFTSPIRSRPCPGRLFLCADSNQDRPWIAASPQNEKPTDLSVGSSQFIRLSIQPSFIAHLSHDSEIPSKRISFAQPPHGLEAHAGR